MRFKRRPPQNQDMVLQITSMADIFTILLVFLLKSFSTGASAITPTRDMMLPEIKKGEQIMETLRVEVSENAIVVDEKPVTELRGFLFDPKDVEANGTPKSLFNALHTIRQKNTLQKFPRMMLFADQTAPYATIKAVMAAASLSGFAEFKLVVVEDQ